MATELQSPHVAEATATETEVPTKLDVNSEASRGKLPSEQEEAGDDYVIGPRGGEIPVGDGHSEADFNSSNYSNESSAGSTPRHEKAEAFLEARKERVEVEANAYLESEIRKVNARAHTAQVIPLATLNILHTSLSTFSRFPAEYY